MGSDNLTTEYLNLISRRADWRFLLSSPSPQKSIIFGDGFLRDAVEFISRSTVDNRFDRNDLNCDLAVAADPDDNTLEECFLSLRPGGECYIEWNRTPLIRHKQIKNKLENVGFRDITFYVPQPSPSKSPPNVWIPLGKPCVIGYLYKTRLEINHKSNLVNPGLKLKQYFWSSLPNLLAYYLWLLNSYIKGFGLCSLACKPHSSVLNERSTNVVNPNKYHSDTQKTVSGLNQMIDLCWNRIIPNNSIASSILMLTEGNTIYKKILLLIFAEHEASPSFVLKMPRTNEDAYLLEMEAQNLQMLEDKSAGIDGIPKVLLADYNEGSYTVGETFISGTKLSNLITWGNYRDLAYKATTWLIDLAIKTKTHNNLRGDPANLMLSNIIRLLGADLNNELIVQTREIIDNLKIPFLVCEHRDFAPQNILIDSKGNLGVIDWEDSRHDGLPALDLIFFHILLNFHLENAWKTGKFREAYRNTLDRSTLAGGIFYECVALYMTKLGIALEETHALRMAALLNRLHIHINGFTIKPTDPEIICKSLFFSLWEEELIYYRKTNNRM